MLKKRHVCLESGEAGHIDKVRESGSGRILKDSAFTPSERGANGRH